MCTLRSLTPFIAPAATIAGIFIGFGLSRIPARRERKRKATGYLRGIYAEIAYAAKHARKYAEGDPDRNGERILAPAYRMLTRYSVDGATWLAGEGIISRTEIEALQAFVAGADEFNRCLDEVDERANEKRREVAGRGADDAHVEYHTTEFLKGAVAVNRAGVKARNICTGDPARGTANDAQKAIRAAATRAGLKLAD